MVLIRLSKEPLTKDANARELAANGGGGPVQSTIHQVMKMISLSNITDDEEKFDRIFLQ